jgi:hypothetical protein
MEGRFRAGFEDVFILPLVIAAWVAKSVSRAVFSFLISILDYAFPIAMQLARFPLFTVRILGDGIIAALKGIIRCLPIDEKNRHLWQELIGQKWSWLRQNLSYRAFEQAVHHAFEGGMEWVFRKCSKLTPRAALLVIAGAVLWLPVSFGTATAIHALLVAKAASWPAWMQFLHPLATIIAKSKLLVLPAYPAAWPQAKKHPFVQALAAIYRDFTNLHLVQKTGYLYRQTERVADNIVGAIARFASLIGLSSLSNSVLSRVNRTAARTANAAGDAIRWIIKHLSQAWLIGPIVQNYAAHYDRVEKQNVEKVSERVRGFFGRWSIKFSAEYYEAKEREKAARPAPGMPS